MAHANSTDLKWYVVQSKPREEKRAAHYLKEKGLEAYLPLIEVANTRSLRNVVREEPLFPSYLFCRLDPGVSLAYARWTQGVAKLLPESSNPFPVEDEFIDALRSLEQKDGVIRKKVLKRDDQIRVAGGPMKGISGIFEHWSSDEGRVRVLLNFVNYQASVELHHSYVEKAS
ncbi:MAG: hypothetical protein JSU72_20185 [Deltaproteobacteria bacterium]|nr:MAG: hypothetical protein JSU72_20185 [Deltaproteobacteria bacterium]